ncbi:MAG: hypothetical protein IPP23_09430 [Sphingomonadales bacterium]|nr:hypothetical protein [Sphingomonadales bacterium]
MTKIRVMPRSQRAVEQLLPFLDHRRHKQPGVGERIAFAFVIAIIEQPQIDMVKIAGHRHPYPAHIGCQRINFAIGRGVDPQWISQPLYLLRFKAVVGQ